MKTSILSLFSLLAFIHVSLAQTTTSSINGNVQINSGSDFSDITITMNISTYNTNGDELNYIEQTSSDALGNYSQSITLYKNPLHPYYGNEYIDAVITFSFSKPGYETEYVYNISLNTTPTTIDNMLLFPSGQETYKPSICMVRYDTITNLPYVIWERESNKNIESYVIYKLVDSKWIPIETTDYTNVSIYEDAQADPYTAYRYQIQANHTDNSRSRYSEAKNAPEIQLITDNGVPKITWTNASEISQIDPEVVHKVLLFRSTTDHNWKQIDSIDISNFTEEELLAKVTFIDKNIPQDGIYKYRIGHRYYTPCDPSKTYTKAESGPFVLAMSNIAESQTALATETSVSYTPSETVSIRSIGTIVLITANNPIEYSIKAIDGKKITQGISGNARIQLPQGVYIISYKNNESWQSQKISIQ